MRPYPFYRHVLSRVAFAAWITCAIAGFWLLHAHESTPGAVGASPPPWPSGTTFTRGAGRPVLIMAVHPRCPCTRASLSTLAESLDPEQDEGTVRLLVYRPFGSAADWAGSSMQAVIATIPGAVVVDDPGGANALRFGLETSGAVAVFDALGRLRFRGGLNVGRGSTVPSEGASAVGDVLAGRLPSEVRCDVYGCPLIAPRRERSQ